jgi:hypothetical protein
MSLTYADFERRFRTWGPELLSEDTTTQADISNRLAYHLERHSAWGQDRRGEAALLLVAHELQLVADRADGVRVSGRVQTGETVGAWSKTFTANAGGDPERQAFQQTDWGQQYLALRSRFRRLPRVGGMPR